jgi:hypothetical protein
MSVADATVGSAVASTIARGHDKVPTHGQQEVPTPRSTLTTG